MFKLYKRDMDGRLLYHEAWANGSSIVEHWGICGERGNTREHAAPTEPDIQRILDGLAEAARSRGYAPILEEDMELLVVEYSIDGMGSTADLDRRHQLEDRFNELVGWLGLGELDGGSIGSGTMEIALIVVDFEIAKAALEAHAVGTGLAGFTQIYRVQFGEEDTHLEDR
jgi:hypothetical protein